MKELEEVWILHTSGVCLFHFAVESQIEPDIFAPVFTAIQQYGIQSAHKIITDITMGENFLMSQELPDYQTLVVGRSSKTRNREEMATMLREICDLFKDQFDPQQISQFDGQVNQFAPFREKITYLFDQQKKLIDNFREIL